jgi:NitT/TauT family transport system substrate-binding protein
MRFSRLSGIRLAATVASLLLATAGSSAETLKFGHSIWVGYGPLYVAQEKGFFKQHGVDVELIVMDDAKLRIAALSAGKIDGMATTADTILPTISDNQQFRYIFAMDDSKGGDGVVVKKEIQSIADLKGKTVGFLEGSVSEFYLSVLLKQVGLTIKDVNGVNMTAGDAGSAFVAGKVDAAVTWEPWLTRGKQAPHGKLLVDSSTSPGLISDIALTTPENLAKRKAEWAAFTRAWNQAVDFVRSNPDEGNKIMAAGVGGWLKDPKVFAEVMEGVKLYGAADNKAFFGTAASPGPLNTTIQNALDLWSSTGRMKVKVTPKDLVVYEFVNQ